jgi:probable phosphoglycerate mutase
LKKLDTTGLAENQEDVRKRVFRLADTFASSDHSIILAVSHGLFTNCLIHFLSNGSIPVTSIKNTSVTKLIYDQGTFTFDYIGRTENL